MKDQINFLLPILYLKFSTISIKNINDKSDSMINLKYPKDNYIEFISSYSFEKAIIYKIKVLALSL